MILLTILIWSATEFFNIVFRGFAPLYPFFVINPKMIEAILKIVNLKPGAVVYELGAGTARFLRAVEKRQPQAKLRGIEYSMIPYLFGKLLLKKEKSHIDLIRKNLFNVNLKDADLIYLYLMPDMMEKLVEKLKKECRPGTMVVSYLFSMPNLESRKKIEAGNEVSYIYQI